MSDSISSEIRETWQVPGYETPLWLGRQHPWCVVIPVINEGERIKNLLIRMAELKIDVIADIVIVDGGSTDGSVELNSIKQFGVRGLLVKTGLGKLSAQLRCAYAFSLEQGYEGVITIDGNDKDDPEAIPRFIAALKNGIDFVQASRYIFGGLAENMPRLRDFAIRFVHAPLLSLFSGFKWTDTTQGFRAYSRRMLLDPNIAVFRDTFKTYELLAYLSYCAPQFGYRCTELPTIRRYPKGEVPTKIKSFRTNLDVLLVLLWACFGVYKKKKNNDIEERSTMLKQFTTVEKLGAIISSYILAVMASLAFLNLTIAPAYPAFVVGHITWGAGTKMQDFIVVPVFIAVFLLSIFLFELILASQERLFKHKDKPEVKKQLKFMSSLKIKLKQLLGDICAKELSNQLILWSLPAIIVISRSISSILMASTMIDINFETEPFLISAVGIGFIIISAILSNLVNKDNTGASIKMFSFWAFAVFLVALLPLGLALILGRITIFYTQEIGLSLFVGLAYAIAVFGIALGLCCVIWNSKKLSQFLPILLLIGQLGLCALFLTLYPARFLQPDGVLVKYETTVLLNLFVLGVIFWSVSDVIYRYKKYLATADWIKLLSPIALFAVLIGFRAGNTVVPHISPDDFHFGEGLLGWWSYLHGAVPYVDFVPPHGLVDNYLPQMLSFFLYDGTAATLEEASRLSFIILAFGAFISLYLFSGNIGLAFISVFFLGGRLAWFFLTPFLCLWFSNSLWLKPSRWLSLWLLTAPIVILGIPSKGLLLVAASGVMALYFLWRLWYYPTERKWIGMGASITVLVVLGFATPLLSMLFGAFRYVIENAPLNQVAYGIPWVLSWDVGTLRGPVFEIVRMSWIAVPIWCFAITYANVKNFFKHYYLLIPAIIVFLFVMLLTPYTMGRIDPGFVSRPGLVAIFGWMVLLPLVLWKIITPKAKVLLILLIAIMGSSLNFMPWSFLNLTPLPHLNLNLTPPSVSNFISAMSPEIYIPPLMDGQSAGMPNIGKAYVQHEQWNRLTRLNMLLNANLAPEEPYLDLTSRNAHYFYFNRRPVIAITAPYNMVPLSQQKLAVEQLSQDIPRLAILEGNNVNHDGGGLALRTPYLYRFIIDNFDPVPQGGFIFGVRNDNVSREQRLIVDEKTDAKEELINDSEVHQLIAIQRLDEFRATLFQKAFSQSEFHKIPLAWGRSENSLERKMNLVKTFDDIEPNLHQLTKEDGRFKVLGPDPFLSFDISTLNLSGIDAGLLRFDFTYVGKTDEPRIQVFWWGDQRHVASEDFSVRFTAGNGSLIIPLDASSKWLTLKHIRGIRIDLNDTSVYSEFSIKNIGLFQRH